MYIDIYNVNIDYIDYIMYIYIYIYNISMQYS